MSDKANISPEAVAKLAHLSRLKLTADEIKNDAGQLAHILHHFASIQSVKTDDVALTDVKPDVFNIKRKDTPFAGLLCAPEVLIKRAPESYKDHIKVSAVFYE